ncbi:DoxX family protein [Kitasatospora sp. MBT63]|uniref:DoxX family protein n=1 Tax=Kitasatospora sp. MBT63 TaxID=1444768 RepID=UPI000539C3FD|nr:DoxX family protein [Kitasatospora sp. MBT63]
MPFAPRETVETVRPHALGLFRIVTGLLFACHGAASLFGVLGGAGGDGSTVAGWVWPGFYAAVIQLVGGVLVLLGVGTRVAALVCSGSMAYAYFSVHQEHGLWPIQNHGEAAALYAWVFLLLVFTGPGSLALGTVLGRIGRPAAEEPATATA